MMNIYNQQNHSNPELPDSSVSATPEPVVKPANFQKYVDPTGEFSSKDLGYSLWYVRHRVTLYRLLTASLVVVSIFLWAFSLWRWGDYAIFGIVEDARLEQQSRQAINYTLTQAHFSAAPLQVLSTAVFSGGVDKYDAVSEVANPNKSFVVRGEYSYAVDGVKTEPRSFIILPGATTLVSELGLTSAGDAQLVVDEITWTRVSAHKIKDVASWQAEHLNFALNDFDFTPLESAGGVKANVITFSLVNQSPYSYVEPHFYLGLYNEDVFVGIVPFSVASLTSLETKKIDLRSFVTSLTATSAQLFPLIDIYDPAVYLPPAK